MSTNGIGSISSLLNTLAPKATPSNKMDAMIQRFLKKADSDGDGKLGSSELSGLSSDAMTALDTDGDGKLSKDEIKTAVQKAFDNIKQAMSSGGDSSALDAVRNSPEGQLMALMRPGKGHHQPKQAQEGQSQQGNSILIQSTSIQINITQTTYTMGGSKVSPDSGSSALNLLA